MNPLVEIKDNFLPNLTIMRVDSLGLKAVLGNTMNVDSLDFSSFRLLNEFKGNVLPQLKFLSLAKNPATPVFLEGNQFDSLENLEIPNAKILSVDGNNVSSLLTLNLSDNVILGTIDNLIAPKLRVLDLSKNLLFGFDNQTYNDLETLDLSTNFMFTTFTNVTLPNIKNLHLQNNLLEDLDLDYTTL